MNAHVEQQRLTSPQKRPQWMRHFAHPEGFVGGLVGHLMAWKNASFNRVAVELLDPQPGDDVLEIGFGPGTAIPLLARRASEGTVSGVDISARMLQQAQRRNRRDIAAGKVRLQRASAALLPFDGASFDRVLAVNNFHIWPDRPAALREIHRVLKPGGIVMLAARGAVAHAGPYTPPGLDDDAVARALEELERAGFAAPRAVRASAGRELVAMMGLKPAA